ncbi:MAG: hypothetical protein OXB99_15505 [Acidimicrobiaceae bacterium]|nr:hypothetical protein [Acidimicrobiaceae bacterium]
MCGVTEVSFREGADFSSTVSVSDAFAVTPAAAQCTATATAGAPVVTVGVGGVRAVRLGVGVGASAVVTVTCTHGGYEPASASATFAAIAADGCEDPLGTLGVVSVVRNGTIAAGSACVSPQRVRDGGNSKRYWARRHTFTLAAPMSVTIDAGSPTRRGLDAYVVLLEGRSADGTGIVAGRDNNSGPRRDARLSGLVLAAGDYTVEVTTANKRRTGSYRLQVAAAAVSAACTDDLGTLAAGRYPRTGTITSACVSTRRGTPTGRPGARWHTFTLAAPAWIDIDLTAAAGSTLDPYLLLIDTNGGEPEIVEQDINSGTGNAAQIRGRYLQAGSYSIETTAATAVGAASSGDYTVTVTVPIHGLAKSYDATVDQQTTLNFNYWPTNANVAAASTEIAVASSRRDGSFSLVVAPERPSGHTVSVRLSTSASMSPGPAGAARGASARGAQRASAHRTVNVTVNGECPSGKTLSPINEVLCVTPSSDSDSRLDDVDERPVYNRATDTYAYYDGPYEVTVGALLGARDAARSAVDARRGKPCAAGRSMGVHELTALMLAIGVWENPNSKHMNISGRRAEANMRFPARSLMTLSRKDHEWTDVEAGDDNSLLYSYNSITRPPQRAFWHPGVGMWQIDKFNSPDLNHGQRADTRFGGVRVAETLLAESCRRTHDNERRGSFEYWLEDTWKACQPSEDRMTNKSQCLRTKDNIWMSNGTRDDLFVTVRNNRHDLSRTGGAELFACRWRTDDGTETIDGGHEDLESLCYLYDTDYPEGSLHGYAPLGGDLRRRPGPATNSSSPYAVPFVSFTDDGVRFAVFPASFLGGHSSTPIKSVPVSELVRTHTGSSWHTDDYLGKDLRLWLCRVGALFAPPQCAWVSASADASTPGGSFASWIAAARG